MSIDVVKIEFFDKAGNALSYLMPAPGEHLDEIAYRGGAYDGLLFTVRITDTQTQAAAVDATLVSWDEGRGEAKESREVTLSSIGGGTFESGDIVVYSGRIKESTRDYFEQTGPMLMPASVFHVIFMRALRRMLFPEIEIVSIEGVGADEAARQRMFWYSIWPFKPHRMYVGNAGTPEAPVAEAPSIVVTAKVHRPDLLEGGKVWWSWYDPDELAGHVPDDTDTADGDNSVTGPPEWKPPQEWFNQHNGWSFNDVEKSSAPDPDGIVKVQFTGTTFGGDDFMIGVGFKEGADNADRFYNRSCSTKRITVWKRISLEGPHSVAGVYQPKPSLWRIVRGKLAEVYVQLEMVGTPGTIDHNDIR